MRKNILSKLLAVCTILMILSGCKSKKEMLSAPESTGKAGRSKSAVLTAIHEKEADFNTISMRAKAGFSINNNAHDASMNIRIQKDEKIWVSVTVIAGIEIARALITPDSLKVINRIESTYTRKPFSYIYRFANEQLNFKTLQALLIGNSDPAFLHAVKNINFEEANTVLSGLINDLAYSMQYNANYKIEKTTIKDEDAAQQLIANYGNFYAVGGHAIPHSVKIQSAAGQNNITINLNYSQVSLNEALDFPFSVSKRFTIKD